ncbi:MAG: phosphopantothenoylcysteine decarboxylase, partial [Lachnospiraceae bacterium]|nr:phosphopantothenoylcysteine decarboxylase [Lachnospiraceae bacterium]
GPVELPEPPFVETVHVVSAKDMFEAVTGRSAEQDIIIKAAAVADYRPKTVAENKMKKKDGELFIELERTKDILAELGKTKRPGQVLCGFSMETENMVENSRAKLKKKNLDLIAANNVKQAGAGFAGDTNIVTIIDAEGAEELPLMSKEEVAGRLLDRCLEKLQ